MTPTAVPLTTDDYRALAHFRSLIRHFIHFSELAARDAHLEPQQHQMMLLICAAGDAPPTIGQVAEQLLIRHHSAVGLADRLEAHGLIERSRAEGDRRQVRLRLTPQGAAEIERLSAVHQKELRSLGPALVASLDALLAAPGVHA
jgi:DNA-binding MarR family transcriptional regulator